MNLKLHKMAVATLAGSLVLGFGANAMADGTFDLVQALVQKGVLTEEEALPLLKGHENDNQAVDKKIKKSSRVTVSDAIDNATIYGDMRVRYEGREGKGPGAGTPSITPQSINENRDRARYKLNLGVKTAADDFYSDIDFAMGAGGRSDNATFGTASNGGTGGSTYNDKQVLFVKRALIGWNAIDWLTLEAGRMDNPLYTTPMVWDADLQFQGLTEKLKYSTLGKTDLFFTASQFEYLGDKKTFSGGTTASAATNEMLVFQGGAKYPINDNASVKAALTYSMYTHDSTSGRFTPGSSLNSNALISAVTATSALPNTTASVAAVNNIATIEIPAEFNFMATNNIGLRLFGDFVYNTDGSSRAAAACVATTTASYGAAAHTAVCNAGNDDTAWMLGVAIGSAADLKAFESNKMAKGDWSARIWYQDVGAYSVDPNAVDSDFMDSRVNMKGVVLKGQYNLRDNVFINLAAGHATRKNGALGTAGTGGDIGLNLNDFNLYQMDLTYKF